MNRILAALCVLLILGALAIRPVQSQTTPVVSVCPGLTNRALVSKGYQQLSVSNTALSLTVPTGSLMAFAISEASPVRWRDDGTAPTTTVGVPQNASSTLILCGSGVLASFQVIAITGTTNFDLSYYGF